ncbi:hypothetical protein OH720_25535 [Pseudomonas sp. WJP1]|uniref:hypothetical protein n=1 Tax=Pseudomonas sp. WJP1 TaxID=2986947 RepID=UPI002349EEA3|nr:hypothetical protein [Pseudomonas sp. WJP1]WCM50290.1 hypothetical protein OH720_25535 [Pseudomonas sp. WJP1]
MAEKIRKCPTSHAEKGDKNGDRENIHSCLVRKKLKKGTFRTKHHSPHHLLGGRSWWLIQHLCWTGWRYRQQAGSHRGFVGWLGFGIGLKFSGLFGIWAGEWLSV